MIRSETQYLHLLARILRDGTWIDNKRTGTRCRTVVNEDLVYDATSNKAPLVTTRKAPVKLPIAELLGYFKGYTNAAEFASLGAKSWYANANENSAWLENPNRLGLDDMGLVYGAVAHHWPVTDYNAHYEQLLNETNYMDLFEKVYHNLRSGKDDRGEIITYWNPGLFHLGCLRPCMHTFQFSLLGEDLYMNVFQRSMDVPLGGASNMVQAWLMLRLMAQITHKNPKYVYHKVVNAHIYEGQIEGAQLQISRMPRTEPTIDINPDIKSLDDIIKWATVKDFIVNYTDYNDPIDYPFSV